VKIDYNQFEEEVRKSFEDEQMSERFKNDVE